MYGVSMRDTVKEYVPDTWNTLYDEQQAEVSRYTQEYRQVDFELRQAIDGSSSVSKITRVQDLHSYGQFLIREQLLLADSLSPPLYRVRRYIQVSETFKADIIKYNLDPRRCDLGSGLIFRKRLSHWDTTKLVCVVVVLTRSPQSADVTPANSTDYYVEYIIEFY